MKRLNASEAGVSFYPGPLSAAAVRCRLRLPSGKRKVAMSSATEILRDSIGVLFLLLSIFDPCTTDSEALGANCQESLQVPLVY